MDVYVYRAALLCSDCGQVQAADLLSRDTMDNGDSGTFPQGPYPDGGGDADCPQHCDYCDTFLGNPLTEYGIAYVQEQLDSEALPYSETLAQWARFYADVLPASIEVE